MFKIQQLVERWMRKMTMCERGMTREEKEHRSWEKTDKWENVNTTSKQETATR